MDEKKPLLKVKIGDVPDAEANGSDSDSKKGLEEHHVVLIKGAINDIDSGDHEGAKVKLTTLLPEEESEVNDIDEPLNPKSKMGSDLTPISPNPGDEPTAPTFEQAARKVAKKGIM